MGSSTARIAEVNMFIYAELLSVPLKLAIFKQFVYLTVGENAVPRWGTALNNHIKFAAALEVITSVVHYSVRMEGGAEGPNHLVVRKGRNFSSLISLWVCSAVSAFSTQTLNSVKAPSTLPECFSPFFPNSLLPSPLMNWHSRRNICC